MNKAPLHATTPPQESAKRKAGKAVGSKDDLFGTGPAKDRRRLDGLRVYSAEELKVNQGGGTLHCPFDCDCCF
ncbi:hypothetical protein WJX81_006511 [Elliptochloris bilobata]|uniref:DUF1764-domain-containing protein n=1 Tax=Elliptochloris bilobata TaxID=381761 RepID=A0AAW1SHC5_9CHLO